MTRLLLLAAALVSAAAAAACNQCPRVGTCAVLAEVPIPSLRIGRRISPVILVNETGTCALAKCAAGYTLYGFSAIAGFLFSSTGLEFTSRGSLVCSGPTGNSLTPVSYWTNGGVEGAPMYSVLLLACLQEITPCKECASNLITVSQSGAQSKPMESDVTSTNGACAVRTFTCTGESASIEIFSITGSAGVIPDGGTGTAKLSVTCNSAGTGWEANGVVVTQVECSALPPPPCKTCAANLITVSQSEVGAGKPMDEDITTVTGSCAVRNFTCRGESASIEIFTATGSAGVIADGGTGSVTFSVTCNSAGTGWEANGVTVTQVECSALPPPPCKSCAANLIAVTQTQIWSKPMDEDVTAIEGSCAVRNFTCKGRNANIEVFMATGESGTVLDEGSGVATLSVACNAAGTGWEAFGVVVTGVECGADPVVDRCKHCGSSWIAVSQTGAGAKPMDGDVTTTTGACAVRTFTCTGLAAIIEVFTADFSGAIDDGGTGVATLEVTCNAAGNGWEAFGQTVTGVECSAASSCKTCSNNTIVVTQTGPLTKPMDGDVTTSEGGCAVRTFTCATGSAGVLGDDGTGSVSLPVTCKSDGSGWEAYGMTVTQVECIATPVCATCTKSMIVVPPTSKPMDEENIFLDENNCAYRQFNCWGASKSIQFFSATGSAGTIVGGSQGATLIVTCRGDGTGWEYNGVVITRVECIAN